MERVTYLKLKKLHHDIVNSLSVMDLGAQALQACPDDKELFQHVCESVRRERKIASDLVGELFDAACDQCVVER